MSGRTRVGVAAAGLTVLALLTAGCGGTGDEAAGTPKVEVSGSSESTGHAGHHMLKARQSLSVPEITEQGARGEILEAFWDYYRVRVQTQAQMDPVMPEYASVMVGDALTAHSKAIAKYNRRGWKLYGAPEITDVEVLSYQPGMSPPQAVVGACVDDGNWRAAGKPPAAKPSGAGVDYTRVGISKEQGSWRVYGVAQESKDQGRC
jgi:hypothetical protein